VWSEDRQTTNEPWRPRPLRESRRPGEGKVSHVFDCGACGRLHVAQTPSTSPVRGCKTWAPSNRLPSCSCALPLEGPGPPSASAERRDGPGCQCQSARSKKAMESRLAAAAALLIGTARGWQIQPSRHSQAFVCSHPSPSSRVQAHPTPLGLHFDSTRSKGMSTDYVLPPSQRWGSAPLRNATSAHGARRPSYVVIWHIAPYWLRPGYSVRHPGPP
jgi:hypothetical protein